MKAVVEAFARMCPCLISLKNAPSDLKENAVIEGDSCRFLCARLTVLVHMFKRLAQSPQTLFTAENFTVDAELKALDCITSEVGSQAQQSRG